MKRTLALVLLLAALPLGAEEPVDLAMMSRIRDEGLHHSQVMDTLYHLTDGIGPRLTGSPQLRAAGEWSRDRFAGWGLANAHLEGYPFGRGWSYSSCQVRMVAPRAAILQAVPRAWIPGTHGPVRGPVMRMKLTGSVKDLEAYRGKVAGKILFLSGPRGLLDPEQEEPRRYSPEDLAKLSTAEDSPGEAPDWRTEARGRWRLRQALNEFLEKEKALATVLMSPRDDGVLAATIAGSWRPGDAVGVPALMMAYEPYSEVLRLLDHGQPVELEIDLAARFHEEDLQAYNTVAEIPGTDKGDELVLAGAHLDSWHIGAGATDDAAGCAIVMEAARILKALGVKPRRTIRFLLWSGEEEGYFGSLAYVQRHLASRPRDREPGPNEPPAPFRAPSGPLQLQPEQAKVSAYFNLDDGAGRIRGIYAHENAAAPPIFAAWLAPFADLGAAAVSPRDVGYTDHIPFEEVGIPAFTFLQDPLDYLSLTHHTNLDTYDHVPAQDVMQASVILAAFLYDAAMRPDLLPRRPLPQEPKRTEPKPDTRKETAP